MPWSAYIPAGTTTRIVGRPLPGQRAVVAVAQAPRTGRTGIATEPIVVRPEDVEIEIRGAGNATRQVNNIMMPGFPADRLLICEVFTPNGNWSGWPPHKHDVDDMPREAVLEETYYYQISRPEGWAIQRVYHRDGSRDLVLPGPSRRPPQRRPGLPPVRLHPGLRRLLPQRPGRRPADDGQLGRPRPRLGPHPVAVDGARSTPPARAPVSPAAADRQRRLVRLGGERGVVAGIAIDHRDSFRVMLERQGLAGLGDADLRELKLRLARVLAPAATAIMLDEEFGGPALDAGAIPASVALIMPLEAQGYETVEDGRTTTLLTDFRPAKRCDAGRTPASSCSRTGSITSRRPPGRTRSSRRRRPPATRWGCPWSSNRSSIAGPRRRPTPTPAPIAGSSSRRSPGCSRSVPTCSSFRFPLLDLARGR